MLYNYSLQYGFTAVRNNICKLCIWLAFAWDARLFFGVNKSFCVRALCHAIRQSKQAALRIVGRIARRVVFVFGFLVWHFKNLNVLREEDLFNITPVPMK